MCKIKGLGPQQWCIWMWKRMHACNKQGKEHRKDKVGTLRYQRCTCPMSYSSSMPSSSMLISSMHQFHLASFLPYKKDSCWKVVHTVLLGKCSAFSLLEQTSDNVQDLFAGMLFHWPQEHTSATSLVQSGHRICLFTVMRFLISA